MKDVTEEKRFYFRSGRIAKNLNDLKEGLSHMEDDEFQHHVNEEKHDFASWIDDAVNDKKLADKVRIEKHREGIIQLIDERIRELNTEIGHKQPAPQTPLLKDTTLLKDFIIGVVVGLIIGVLIGRFLF